MYSQEWKGTELICWNLKLRRPTFRRRNVGTAIGV
jgi:hypothetical protein